MQTEDVTTKSKHILNIFVLLLIIKMLVIDMFGKKCATDPAPHLILHTRNGI